VRCRKRLRSRLSNGVRNISLAPADLQGGNRLCDVIVVRVFVHEERNAGIVAELDDGESRQIRCDGKGPDDGLGEAEYVLVPVGVASLGRHDARRLVENQRDVGNGGADSVWNLAWVADDGRQLGDLLVEKRVVDRRDRERLDVRQLLQILHTDVGRRSHGVDAEIRLAECARRVDSGTAVRYRDWIVGEKDDDLLDIAASYTIARGQNCVVYDPQCVNRIGIPRGYESQIVDLSLQHCFIRILVQSEDDVGAVGIVRHDRDLNVGWTDGQEAGDELLDEVLERVEVLKVLWDVNGEDEV